MPYWPAFAVVIFGLASVYFVLPRSLSASCGEEVVDEAVSPDRKLKVVVVERNCGATTGYVTLAGVIENREKRELLENPFFVVDGSGKEIKAKWDNNTSVRILRKLNGSESKSLSMVHHKRNLAVEYGW